MGIVTAVLACLLSMFPQVSSAQTPNETPDAIKGLDVVEHLGEKIPLDLPFTDSDGRPVVIGEFFNTGRPVLLVMVYFRCPMQCPFTLDRYQNRFRELTDFTIGKEYNVIVVSFDPTDTPKVAKERKDMAMLGYDRSPADKISNGWRWLTTSDAAVSRKLADAVGFQYRYLPTSNEYAHPSATFAIAPDGTITRYLYGLDTSARDLKLSLLEASQGKIGSSIDKVLLFCFHFDPKTGTYTLAAFRVMQIGGVLSMIFVGTVIGLMLAFERRRKRRKALAASHIHSDMSTMPTGLAP